MNFVLFLLVLTYSFSASAEEKGKSIATQKAKIIRVCENPDSGEQIEFPLNSSETCPSGFRVYDDLTPVHVEHIEDIPPPKPLPNLTEKGAYAE